MDTFNYSYSLQDYGSKECKTYKEIDKTLVHTIPLTVTSSLLSLIGSLLTIVTFIAWKDLRQSTASRILLFLGISDFLTAVGYFAAGTAHYYFFTVNGTLREPYAKTNTEFPPFCAFQAFTISLFSTASFFWTSYLAVYFVIVIITGVYRWNKRLLVFLNLTAWPIPLVICTVALTMKYLGVGETFLNAAPGVCFVSSNHTINFTSNSTFEHGIVRFLVVEAVSMKLWEFIAMVTISVCYVMIFIVNRYLLRQVLTKSVSRRSSCFIAKSLLSKPTAQSTQSVVVKPIQATDIKLLAIPIVFIVLRIWGTLRYFISMWPACHRYEGPHHNPSFCVEQRCFDIFYHPALLYPQAFCDPLQGFCNAILFIFMSKMISKRLLALVRSHLRLPESVHQRVYGNKLQQSINAADERDPLIKHESVSVLDC